MQTTGAKERKVRVGMMFTKKIPENCGRCEFFKRCTYNLDGRCFWVECGDYVKVESGRNTVIIMGFHDPVDVAWIKNLFLT
ncbi:MAG: hypothetical protein HQ593_06085 [Candidatus Omnitrophica bacterium]|nr:hypothetical protein [Candidatus Omnitrophota bacterium]